MEPYIGMMVHLVKAGMKQRFAAVVTQVWDSNTVNLRVFDDIDSPLHLSEKEQPRMVPRLPKDGQIKDDTIAWAEIVP